MTILASNQLALLKTIDNHGRNDADAIDNKAMARMQNAIGTTTRLASNETGVAKWKYQNSRTNDPVQAANEIAAP